MLRIRTTRRARAKQVLAARKATRTRYVEVEPHPIWEMTRDWRRSLALRIALWLVKGEPMPDTLVEMQSIANAVPKTLVAFDLNDGTQLVGSFVRYGVIKYKRVQVIQGHQIEAEDSIVVEPFTDPGTEIEVPYRDVLRGYWAPAGYRAERPTRPK